MQRGMAKQTRNSRRNGMNPELVYRDYQDDAFAKLVEAKEYRTFVAMPFSNWYNYDHEQVLKDVIQAAAEQATKIRPAELLPFAAPQTVSTPNAGDITEEIVRQILDSHFVIADLTRENFGAVLEAGVAFALKPTSQIILICQQKHDSLHFDIKVNNVIKYTKPDDVKRIAKAFIVAAQSFEEDKTRQLKKITECLHPDASWCLKFYGRYIEPEHRPPLDALCPDIAHDIFKKAENPQQRFHDAVRDLLDRRLVWTDWADQGNGAKYGLHPTELGRAVMKANGWLAPHQPAQRRPKWRSHRIKPPLYSQRLLTRARHR